MDEDMDDNDKNNNEDNAMSQSLVSFSGLTYRRKRHPELTPVLPRDRYTEWTTSCSSGRIIKDKNSNSNTNDSDLNRLTTTSTPKRAVSMTRLDQLAKPRRRYLEENLKAINSAKSRENNVTSPMSSSLLSPTDTNKEVVKMRAKPTVPRKPRPVTIGTFDVDRDSDVRETPNRGSRSTEKKAQSTQPTPALRSSRARSAGASLQKLSVASPEIETKHLVSAPKPTPPRKPAHVKAAAMARKTTKQTEKPIDLIAANVSAIEINDNKVEDVKQEDIKVVNDESVPIIEPKESETIISPSMENSDSPMPSSKKEISQEEYKKMMAEKRKLAREQAEREAELERQRIENERLEELERQRKEEEEQKRLEEEQLRLLEEQKRAEEERLRKAVEESRIRDEMENKRKEEEARARVEKEEKERKAKEESERQRLELEERLKKDEEERLARKKKLEAIMSRTRKSTPNARGSSPSNSPNETPEPQLSDSTGSTPEKIREEANNYQNILKNDLKDEQLVIITTNSDITSNVKPDIVEDVNRAQRLNMKDQFALNGGSHNNHIVDYSPEASLEVNNLINYNEINSAAIDPSSQQVVGGSLEQLINLNYSNAPNTEDVNSNHVSPIISSSVVNSLKNDEQSINDLLS